MLILGIVLSITAIFFMCTWIGGEMVLRNSLFGNYSFKAKAKIVETSKVSRHRVLVSLMGDNLPSPFNRRPCPLSAWGINASLSGTELKPGDIVDVKFVPINLKKIRVRVYTDGYENDKFAAVTRTLAQVLWTTGALLILFMVCVIAPMA